MYYGFTIYLDNITSTESLVGLLFGFFSDLEGPSSN